MTDIDGAGCREMDEAASTDEAFADYVENVDVNESDSECENEVCAQPTLTLSAYADRGVWAAYSWCV